MCNSCTDSRVEDFPTGILFLLTVIAWDFLGLRSLVVTQPCLGNCLFAKINKLGQTHPS